ncbi:MAG TPA: amino acid adenylation domain-containing protein [Candidatus Angelobacter sp.]|jgi:amino acid adenylation domain-containing protein|nr:amino acid adenylation domain-containing protein [Candidatus Angelobacter sp.]
MSDITTSARVATLSPEKRKLFEQRIRGVAAASSEIPKRAPGSFLELSFAQQRLWFLDQLVPGNPFYNIFSAVPLKFALNIGVMRRVLNEIVRRHEALRTSFATIDGKVVQVIAPTLHLDLPVTDLRPLESQAREPEAVRLAYEEARIPFDLAQGPLIRAKLLHLDAYDYVLLLTMHHIVSDGWSMGIFFDELSALYTCYATGQPSTLRELPVQYADFALWQRAWLQGDVLDKQLSYWRRQLDGIPKLELPSDRPRPQVAAFHGAYYAVQYPKGIAGALKRVSEQHGATLFMTLLAAFQVLLHRYTGQDDIAIGSPVANRNRSEIEKLIGFFVNSLVMRASFEGDPTFGSSLAEVRRTAVEAYANQDLPFEMLVEKLQPDRDLSRNPLFQVIFQLMNAPTVASGQEDGSNATATTPYSSVQSGTSKFDLNVTLGEFADSLVGGIEYNTDLFDESTITRLSGHYLAVLHAIIANPKQRISEMALLTALERQQVLVDWNTTTADFPRARSLASIFEEQVNAHATEPAVVYEGRSLTYAELNCQANRLAHYLRSLGVGRSSRAGICVRRSPEMVIAVLGVIKSGAAYVPLDPDYPKERLAFMIDDAGLEVLIAQTSLVGKLTDAPAPAICVESDLLSGYPAGNPNHLTDGDDLAYVMYTSGSTGAPKGVAIRQQSITRLVCNNNYAQLGAGDRIAQVSSFSFDAATFEIWGALLNGGQLVGFSKELLLSPADFAAELELQEISAMFLTVALFNQIARECPQAFRTVRSLLVGGEALDPKWIRRVLDSGAPSRLLNGYGPTETTTFAVCHLIQNLPSGVSSIPIGRPITNTAAYVLDKYGEPVPIGVHGELYLGGPGVAREYWKRPELTAERFVPDPFSGNEGERLYRTGDKVRYLADGAIDFLGRIDQQIKLRGFRIELGEIETVLNTHPSVKSAVVMLREDRVGDRRLVAYIVQNPGLPVHNGEPDRMGDAQLQHWQRVYDEVIYSSLDQHTSEHHEALFNIKGWASTYTQAPLPPEVMIEQVDQTVSRILALRPKRVLEIGCGTGLLLARIAPGCEFYAGTDFSAVALDYLRQQISESQSDFSRTTLLQRTAEDFSGFEDGSFDVVVLNSVVQYFPSAEYLLTIVRGALRVLAPEGAVFLGDLRNLLLLEAFHTSLVLHGSGDDDPVSELRSRLTQSMYEEQELILAPAFFHAIRDELPAITAVEARPKRGHNLSELTQFRYDVILRTGEIHSGGQDFEWMEWRTDKSTVEQARRKIESGAAIVALKGVPNARVTYEVNAAALVKTQPASLTALRVKEQAKAALTKAADPEEFWSLGEQLGYDVDLRWDDSDTEGRFDVLLRRYDSSAPLPATAVVVPELPQARKSWRKLSNTPAEVFFYRKLVPQLRSFLEDSLPVYMMPAAFVLLEELPLSPNGKLDRRALPAAGQQRWSVETEYVAPRNELEQSLVKIWSEVQGIKRIGVHDNFFVQLGGHSLTATQLISRVREKFNIEIPIRTLFEKPTIAQFGEAVAEHLKRTEQPSPAKISRIGDEQEQSSVDVDKLSDEEVNAMLAKLLTKEQG